MEHKLVFKWGVSRGRDTYGYRICSLLVDDTKVSMCNGGGYDMKGTCFGDWVAHKFKDELLKLEIPWGTRNGEKVQEYYGLTFHDPNYDPGKAVIDGKNCCRTRSCWRINRSGKIPVLLQSQLTSSN